MNKNNEMTRAEWAKYYVSYAKSKGIPCFWWDNGVTTGDGELFGLLNRGNNSFTYPVLLAAMMEGAEGGVPPIPQLVITLEDNDPWGWQSFYDSDTWFGSKIEKGKEFTFTYSFKSNIAIDYLQVVLVDNSEEAPGWWQELSEYIQVEENIVANTEYSGMITITVTETASSTAPDANKFALSTGTGTKSAPTLTFTIFSIDY